jgi:hypothetical protein
MQQQNVVQSSSVSRSTENKLEKYISKVMQSLVVSDLQSRLDLKNR